MKVYSASLDPELMDLMKSGDKLAFAEIYNRYWKLLIDAAYQRLKSVEAAEEVVQDVFVSFYMRREVIVLNSSLEAYFKPALKYKVFNIYRRQIAHYNHVESIIRENRVDPVMPDLSLEAKEFKARVLRTADKMPEKCREVFLLSRFEHLSNQDIAKRMDISVSTVKKHITKSMKIMRDEFQGYGIDLLAICMIVYLS